MYCLPTFRTIKKPIVGRFFVGLVVAGFGFSVMATETGGSEKSISLNNAIALTLSHHPELKALAFEERVWKGEIQQAGIGELPQIGLMLEDAMGTGQHSGIKSMQSTLTFSWVLQQQVIDKRVDALKTQASQLVFDKQIKALDLSALVAKQYIDILVKHERLKLNQMALLQAKDVENTITSRVDAGKSSAIELQLAHVDSLHRELALEDIEHELSVSKYQLTSYWGAPATNVNVSGDLLALPVVNSVENQLALLKQNPRITSLVSSHRIIQSQIELARIEAKPQWRFNAGLRRNESTDDFSVVAGVSIPWGSGERNAGSISALQARQDVISAQQAALLQSLDMQLYDVLHEMAHSDHVIRAYRSNIIPALEQAVNQARDAFEDGQISYGQLNNIRQELLTAQFQLLDAVERLHLQHIEIQRLTGSSISQ